MSQSKILVLVVALVVVAGGGYYFMQSQGANSTAETSTGGTPAPTQGIAVGEPNPATPVGKKMAFADFMKQGGSYKCTVHQSVNNVDTQGTTYMDGGMVRGEFTSTVQGMDMTASLIVRDGYTYSWTSMMPTMGFKSKVDPNAGGDTKSGTSGTYTFNAETIGDYDCQPWTPDKAMFTLPAGTTFTEVNKPQ